MSLTDAERGEAVCRAIAVIAHRGQTDKLGRPYIEHVRFVASKFYKPELRSIAYLHDVLEDTDIRVGDLIDAGVPDGVVISVLAITRRPGEVYRAYIERVSEDSNATVVKMADLEDNLAASRVAALHLVEGETEGGILARVKRYREARFRLVMHRWPDEGDNLEL